MSNVSKITVSNDLVISGPANYMQQQFPKWKAEFEAKGNAVVEYGMNYKGLSFAQALEIAIQTDYAGWKGMQSFINR